MAAFWMLPPPTCTAAATPTTAKSPLRRANSANPKPAPAPHTGKRTAVSSSPVSMAVMNVPWKKSAAPTVRVAPLDASTNSASRASRHRRQLGGRVGVGERAADRAAVADLEVADPRDRQAQQGDGGGGGGVLLHGPLAGHGPDLEVAVGALGPLEGGDAVEVDEVVEAREPQRQQRDQALAAGERLGVVAVLGEQPDGVVDAVGRVVLERRGLHGAPSGVA